MMTSKLKKTPETQPLPFAGHNAVFYCAGCLLLWLGFYGFNGGTACTLGQKMVWCKVGIIPLHRCHHHAAVALPCIQ